MKEIDQKANYKRMGDLCTSMKLTMNENKSKPIAKNDELANKVFKKRW